MSVCNVVSYYDFVFICCSVNVLNCFSIYNALFVADPDSRSYCSLILLSKKGDDMGKVKKNARVSLLESQELGCRPSFHKGACPTCSAVVLPHSVGASQKFPMVYMNDNIFL